MPWSHDQATQSLRLTYNAAVAAHADCSRALTEASMRGEAPSPALVEAALAARLKLEDSRARLHAAMASALGPIPEPPVDPRR
jgi:hypothetical protein